MADEPVLDMDTLGGYTHGDPALEAELAELFVATSALYLDEMREAVAAGLSWKEPAHSLKGASGNFGARRMASLALTAEHAEPNRVAVEALDGALAEVRAFFEARGNLGA